MFVQRIDHAGITVSDLEGAVSFFAALGLEEEVRTVVEGEFIDTVTGIDARVTEDGCLRLYNLSGETLTGELACSAPYASDQIAGLDGKTNAVTVPPYSLIVFRAADEKATWSGAFAGK